MSLISKFHELQYLNILFQHDGTIIVSWTNSFGVVAGRTFSINWVTPGK